MINYHTLFSQIGATTAVKKKVEMLQEEDTPNLRAILRAAYDEKITFTVPDTKPPYEVNEEEDWEDVPMKLHDQVMQFGRFANINDGPTHQAKSLTRMQRETSLIGVLQGLHKHEADIVVNLLKRKISYNGITPSLVEQAFPGLLGE